MAIRIPAALARRDHARRGRIVHRQRCDSHSRAGLLAGLSARADVRLSRRDGRLDVDEGRGCSEVGGERGFDLK